MEKSYHKIEIAERTIGGAIEALERGDYLSALIMAGCADSLLGEFMQTKGRAPVIDGFARAYADAYGADTPRKAIIQAANHARDRVRHHGNGEPDEVSLDLEGAAPTMIERASTNFIVLTTRVTPAMRRYEEWRLARSRGDPAQDGNA